MMGLMHMQRTQPEQLGVLLLIYVFEEVDAVRISKRLVRKYKNTQKPQLKGGNGKWGGKNELSP